MLLDLTPRLPAAALQVPPFIELAFTVPGEPQGKGRPRAMRIGTGIRLYTPAATESYEARIALFAREAMGGDPPFARSLALRCAVTAVYGVAGSWSQRKRTRAITGALRPLKKPDGDNILKAIGDGLGGVAWVDDVQVVEWSLAKLYGASGELRVRIAPVLP